VSLHDAGYCHEAEEGDAEEEKLEGKVHSTVPSVMAKITMLRWKFLNPVWGLAWTVAG